MKDFKEYLDQTNEVGIAEQVFESIVVAEGLPNAHPGEIVIFETGEVGFVLSLNENKLEILLFSPPTVGVGTRIVRTDHPAKLVVDDNLLGKVLTSEELTQKLVITEGDGANQARQVDVPPAVFSQRRRVDKPLETGVTMVDLLIPLGKGQRQLVIGDRKTGKSSFLLQVVRNQARKGTICIYAAIGKTRQAVQRISENFQKEKIEKQTIIVTTHASEPSGLMYLNPYVAMTIAEYFRDQGKDVLLVLDDLTTHARYYREFMLLARRFPGRSSYPGDIFYTHARLIERAGNFEKGNISCLPVAQSVLGDLSGFIQTNIMAMTDGHLFFDSDLWDQGRRPALNPFLSVTRVGEQTQTPLVQNIGRQLRSFLVQYEKLKQFKHFQTELGENVRSTFEIGDRLTSFFEQTGEFVIPLNINLVIFAGVWSNFWKNVAIDQMKKEMIKIAAAYQQDQQFQKEVDEMVNTSKTFPEFIETVQGKQSVIFKNLNQQEVKDAKQAQPESAPTAAPATKAEPTSQPEPATPAPVTSPNASTTPPPPETKPDNPPEPVKAPDES